MAVEVKLGSMTLDWRGDDFVNNVKRAAAFGVTETAGRLAEKMRLNIGIQGPPRSVPGAFPRMDTRTLRESVDSTKATPSSLVAYAGVDKSAGYNKTIANYGGAFEHGSFSHSNVTANDVGLWLEFGTSKMAPRPWILRTLMENRNTLFAHFMITTQFAMNTNAAGTPKGIPSRSIV